MKRPVTLTIAAVLVLLLIAISAVWPLVGGQNLFGGIGPRNGGGFPKRDFSAENFQQGTPPARSRENQNQADPGQPGRGTENSGSGTQFQPGGRMPANRGGAMQLLRVFQYVLYAVELVLGLVAFGGLWASKRWGIVLAIITSAVVLVTTVLGFFRPVAMFPLIENLLKALIAIGIIVLVVLPKPKQVQATA